MRKNIKYLMGLIVLVLIIIISIVIFGKQDLNKNPNYSSTITEKDIAIMVYDKATGGYVKQSNFPIGRYTLSSSSYCTNGSTIGNYDSSTGTVGLSLSKSDKCYFYFDLARLMADFSSFSGDYFRSGTLTASMSDRNEYTYNILIYSGVSSNGDISSITPSTRSVSNASGVSCQLDFGEDNYYTKHVLKVVVQDADGNLVDEATSHVFTNYCFVAGTKIRTETGQKNIEDIKVGDKVYSYNLDNNALEIKKVTQLISSETHFITKVYVGDKVIEMSNRHQVYVIDRGWVRAKDLQIGDQMLDTNEKIITIENVEQLYYDETVPTYNFTVEDNHNYYVSDLQVLVHNAGSPSDRDPYVCTAT